MNNTQPEEELIQQNKQSRVQEQLPQQQQPVSKESKQAHRIAKEWRQIQINFSSYIEAIIALEKEKEQEDNSYKVFIYFSNGKYQVWDITTNEPVKLTGENCQIKEQSKYFQCLNSKEMLYLDGDDKKIKILDIYTGNKKDYAINIPTPLAMSEQDKTPEKLENLYADGIRIEYNPTTKCIIVLEMKQSFMNSQENVLTCFKLDQEEPLWQKSFNETEQRELSIITMKDEKNTTLIFGNSYQDQQLKLRVFGDDQDSLVEPQMQNKFNAQIIEGFCGQNEKQLIFWCNPNNSGIPIQIKVDIETGESSEVELNMFLQQDNLDDEEMGGDQYQAWFISDVYFYDNKRNMVIAERCCQDGNYIDLFNPETLQVSYTQTVNNSPGCERTSFSPDGKYFVIYEEGQAQEEIDKQENQIQLTINTLVNIRTSICYFLEKSGVMDIYVPKCENTGNSENIMATKQKYQKPNLENEHFLQELIDVLTTGKSK